MSMPNPAARPRILHVVNDLDSGGLERNLLALTQHTADRFVHLVCCVRKRGVLADEFEAAAVEVRALNAARRDFSVAWRLAQECRRLQPDLVHTRNWGTVDGIIGARLARVPAVIHSEHGWDTLAPPRRRAWALRALSPWIDFVVAVSDHLGHHLSEHVGIRRTKVSVIRNGVDGRRFRPVADRHRLRRELGLEPAGPLVIAVGRLDPVKNYPGLIAAFGEVRRLAPEARLVIVGNGPEQHRIEHEVSRRDLGSAVRLVGFRDDVDAWLAAADIFTHCSLSEGMTNAALEAMATGLPVVASRVGGLQEIVVDGVTGRLVPCADANALANAVADYCNDPPTRAQHGHAGRERVLGEFTREAMTVAYVDLYERAIAGRRPPATVTEH